MLKKKLLIHGYTKKLSVPVLTKEVWKYQKYGNLRMLIKTKYNHTLW